MFGPTHRGWISYYVHFYKSTLFPTMYNFNRKLEKWVTQKYKKVQETAKTGILLVGADSS